MRLRVTAVVDQFVVHGTFCLMPYMTTWYEYGKRMRKEDRAERKKTDEAESRKENEKMRRVKKRSRHRSLTIARRKLGRETSKSIS